MVKTLTLTLLSLYLTSTHSMIMRNNALMTKMVSQFQGKENNRENKRPRDHEPHINQNLYPDVSQERFEERNEDLPKKRRENQESEGSPAHVLSLMQNVLCKNFPSVPCNLITKDETLINLIGKSIQQLNYKKYAITQTTEAPKHQMTLYPAVNSEDLSNFLQVSNTGMFNQKNLDKKQNNIKQEKNYWTHDGKSKSRTALFHGSKKIRKYYPHKIKYKDKGGNAARREHSDENLSISVEAPREKGLNIKRKKHFSYRGEPADPPVWRIDYMKHGEPSLNLFGYEESLKGKLIKSGPNVIVDDSILDKAARRDVMHPEVLIKKNYPRKNNNDNSGIVD